VALLKGVSVASMDEVYHQRLKLNPGAAELVHACKAAGLKVLLVSGGFTFFTERVAHAVGFNVNQANRLIFVDGKLTGGIAEPILGREAKTEALVRLRGELGLHREETLAVGDGANDLGMIGEAGLGVAYHAKPVVAEAADARIDHGDLTALLYMQGYRREEIVTGH
ncbi:MAG: HAD-IB family phosphatase, partial [Parvibaculum sp.]|nr:HAD-IB family phosphatase [Parvibaculum sp.]